MKGTEKQISWAEDIKTAVVNTIDTMLETVRNDPRSNNEKAKAAQAKFQRAREAVAACENAHDLIEVYQGVGTNRSERDNMMAVSSRIANKLKVRYETPAQQALIGE